MENLAGKYKKEIAEIPIPTSTRKQRRWELLAVGDHGEILSVRWFKTVMILIITALVVAITVSVYLSFIYRSILAENKILKTEAESSRQQLKSFKGEMDILMARLVLTESKLEEKISERIEEFPESIVEKPEELHTSPETVAEDTVGEKIEEVVTENDMDIVVTNFSVYHDSSDNTLHVRFNISNKQPDVKMSGYIFTILKADDNLNNWLIIPSVALSSGRPSVISRGQYFKISRFKPVRFKVRNQTQPEQFKKASVFIFKPDGTLMLEKNMLFEIKPFELPPES